MNEADIRLAVSHALQWHGWWPQHVQDGRLHFCAQGHPVLVTAERKGYPDIRAEHPRFEMAHIEVKAIAKNKKSFAKSQIEPEQRNYLNKWTSQGGAGYLAIGKIEPMGSRSTIGGIWVFPWSYWCELETTFEKSIAYDWDLYEKRPEKWERTDSIVWQASSYQLFKSKTDDWQFMKSHPLAAPKKVEVPYFKQEKVRANDAVPEPEQVTATD